MKKYPQKTFGLSGKKILITSGPTSVPIDDVRVITNRSTGEMGRLIAAACAERKARVTLLEGNVTTALPLKDVKVRKFCFFSELDNLLKQELKRGYDGVIHAAAVSDFVLKKPFKGKLASDGKMTLELVPTRKILVGIKKTAPKTVLVGFKLETKLEKNYIFKQTRFLFEDAGCDLVVANSISSGRYRAFVIDKDGKLSRTVTTKRSLVAILIKKLEGFFK